MKMKLFANIISIQNEKHQITNRVSLMTLVSAVPSVALAQAEVEQWGRFEQTFKGPSEGNPFTDV